MSFKFEKLIPIENTTLETGQSILLIDQTIDASFHAITIAQAPKVDVRVVTVDITRDFGAPCRIYLFGDFGTSIWRRDSICNCSNHITEDLKFPAKSTIGVAVRGQKGLPFKCDVVFEPV